MMKRAGEMGHTFRIDNDPEHHAQVLKVVDDLRALADEIEAGRLLLVELELKSGTDEFYDAAFAPSPVYVQGNGENKIGLRTKPAAAPFLPLRRPT